MQMFFNTLESQSIAIVVYHVSVAITVTFNAIK